MLNFNDLVASVVKEGLKEILKHSERTYGFIERAEPLTMNGTPGFLIWDYIVWNEISFLSSDRKTSQSLFTSFSDKATEKRFNEIMQRYNS